MAVEDKYVDTDIASGQLGDAGQFGERLTFAKTFEIAAGDDSGSVYRLFTVPDTWKIAASTVMCDAITGATEGNLGTYVHGVGGAEIDKDCLMDGQTLATASRVLDGLKTVAIEDIATTPLYSIAGDTASRGDVDIALTAVTLSTTGGTVTVIMDFIQ